MPGPQPRPSRRTGYRKPVKGKRGRCPTGKPRYRTMGEASATATHRSEQADVRLWTYECPYCQGWHLTSLAADEYQTRREGAWATGSGH